MDQILEKIKEYASKAKEESAKLGKQAYEKANSAVASTKLSFAISETDSKIKEVYQAIGKAIYDDYLEKGEATELVSEACTTLDELFKEKLLLREKKAEIKNAVPCAECGEYNKAGAAYCSSCGAKLEEEAEVDASIIEEDDDMLDDIKEKAEEVKEKVEDAVDAVKAKIPEDVKDKADDIKDRAEDVFEDVKDKAEDAFETMKAKMPEMKEKAEEVKDKVEETVKKVIKIKPRKPADE